MQLKLLKVLVGLLLTLRNAQMCDSIKPKHSGGGRKRVEMNTKRKQKKAIAIGLLFLFVWLEEVLGIQCDLFNLP